MCVRVHGRVSGLKIIYQLLEPNKYGFDRAVGFKASLGIFDY